MAYLKAQAISSAQCRAARGLLGWTQVDLARETKLSKTAIVNFESDTISSRGDTLHLIAKAFMRYGVEFIQPNGVNRQPMKYKGFLEKQGMEEEWPHFIKEQFECGNTTLTVCNWPMFPMEVRAIVNQDINVVEKSCSTSGSTALLGPWIIMPILNTHYRVAVYYDSADDFFSSYVQE